jgi:hypothetical protein
MLCCTSKLNPQFSVVFVSTGTIQGTTMLKTLLLALLLTSNQALSQTGLTTHANSPSDGLKIETSYDAKVDKTTVRLAPVQISGENGKYRSLQMAPAFSYRGKEPRTPEIIDFELRTVVKGRLDTDLYVLFVIDGEKVFLSSNRWAIKRPVPGRVWVGERPRIPYALRDICVDN